MTEIPEEVVEAALAAWHDGTIHGTGNAHMRHALKAASDSLAQRFRAVLRDHYLAQITCDHDQKMDNPVCACSLVNLGWHPSVGAAVEAWIDHVLALRADELQKRS